MSNNVSVLLGNGDGTFQEAVHHNAADGPGSVAVDPEPSDEIVDLDTVVARHIRRALEVADGKIHGPGGAGELLGVNPNTLRSRMRKLGIPFSKG